MQKLMNNFSARTTRPIYIHQLFAGVFQADFRAAALTLGNVNIILIVRRPWSKAYTRTIHDVVHGLVNCRNVFGICKIDWVLSSSSSSVSYCCGGGIVCWVTDNTRWRREKKKGLEDWIVRMNERKCLSSHRLIVMKHHSNMANYIVT